MTKQVFKISILGIGWLGKPLAEALVLAGHQVKGSSTSPEKMSMIQALGVAPYLLTLSPEPEEGQWDEFLEADILLINIPPQTRKAGIGADFHPSQIQNLLAKVTQSKIQKIIYVSATSVYPEAARAMTEAEPINAQNTGNTALWHAEQLIRKSGKDWLILRLGGLLGYERIPGKYFAGKKDLETGDVPVNFIHRDDAVKILCKLMAQKDISKEIFNIVSPEHPPRSVIYTKNAQDFGFEAPTFKEMPPKNHKIILAQKIQLELEYVFKYPNPLDYRYS